MKCTRITQSKGGYLTFKKDDFYAVIHFKTSFKKKLNFLLKNLFGIIINKLAVLSMGIMYMD